MAAKKKPTPAQLKKFEASAKDKAQDAKGGNGYAKGGKITGFKANQNAIAQREGVSKKSAGAILASNARNASPAAKAKNPNLLKVKGKKGK